jgi:hypothetical protein
MTNQNEEKRRKNVSGIEERAMTAYKGYHEGGNQNGDWLHDERTCACVFPRGQMPVFLPILDFIGTI